MIPAAPPIPSDAPFEADRAPPFVELVLHPERFFRERDLAVKGLRLLLLLGVLGLASVLDRLEWNALSGKAAAATWAAYWGSALGMAILGGPLRWFVGGWWFRMRLLLSGAVDPDADQARRISALSDLIWMVPTIVRALVVSFRYATPAAAAASSDGEATWLLVFLACWSIYVSYRGAAASHPLERGKALVWFAILPALLLLAIMGLGFKLGTGR